MRLTTFLTTTLSALAFAAAAQAAEVNVTIGPRLQDQASQYGQRDLDYLADELRESVQQALERSGTLADAGTTIDLVIEDATPNRPTFRQMAMKPGLSYESFGIGGAQISGVLTTPDGRQVPLGYRWYETDIRWAQVAGTWSDAENTFDRFARKLVNGDAVAER